MQTLLSRLNMTLTSRIAEEAYQAAIAETTLPEWLREDYVLQLNEELGLIETNKEVVLRALSEVVANSDLTTLAKMLYYILGSMRRGCEGLGNYTLPASPAGYPVLGCDFVALFPLMGHIRSNYEDLIKRGVPEAIVKGTLSALDESISISSSREGRPAFNKTYLGWCYNYINGRLLKIGRLDYQIWPGYSYPVHLYKKADGETAALVEFAKLDKAGYLLGSAGHTEDAGAVDADLIETEEYYEGYPVDPDSGLSSLRRVRLSKHEWQEVLKRDGVVINIHIPAGSGMTEEALTASIESARAIFGRAYPEFDPKVFFTSTWLLSPELDPYLKPTSNIRIFQKLFKLFPTVSRATSIYSFIFGLIVSSPAEVDISSLKEETSLQRSIKAHLAAGGLIHEWGGYFLF